MATQPAYIWHVTLDTGHTKKSNLSDVGDNVINALRPMLADGHHDIVQCPGYSADVTIEGKSLTVKIMHGREPIATIGVALKSRSAGGLWRALHDGRLLSTHGADVPRAPWCAARLEAGFMTHLDAAEWLGDFEQCVAWIWWEMQQ